MHMRHKIKINGIISLIFATILQFSIYTYGQCPDGSGSMWCLGSTTDYLINTQTTVVNTGCDVQAFGDTYIAGFVYDGTTAKFEWRNDTRSGWCAIDGVSGGGAISDPDVVITNDGLNLIIIYQQDSKIYFESKRLYLFSNTCTDNQPATLLSSTLSSSSSYPNIDIDYDIDNNTNYIAATWIEKINLSGTYYYYVKGRAGSFNNSTQDFDFSTYITTISAGGINSYQPDVCINSKGSVTDHYVTFTYLSGNLRGLHNLIYRGDTWNNLFNNSLSNPAVTLKSSNFPCLLSKPRIATKGSSTSSNRADFQIVVALGGDACSNNYKYQIIGFNNLAPYIMSENIINQSPDITSVPNSDPVVTFTSDWIIVSWVNKGDGIPGNTPDEIIAKRLYALSPLHGQVIDPTYYSVVNSTLSYKDSKPSIAGKGFPGPSILYNWCKSDGSSYSIYCKKSQSTNYNLKFSGSNTEKDLVNLYPNPATDILTIDFGADDDWLGSNLKIINIHGQKVKEISISEISTSIDISSLKEGLYFVKITNNNNILLKKIMITH
jgi:hypothetical protein